MQMKANKKLPTVTLLLPLLLAASVNAAPNPQGKAYGFRALTGQQAAGYSLPNDVALAKTLDRGNKGSSQRFQQFVDGTEVLGGQLTLVRDPAGKLRNVIGSHYPGLVPSNTIKLRPTEAQGVAAERRGDGGTWRTKLMIDPKDGRYFYNVENLHEDSRWFYWVDAEDGTVINSYDGLTTGSGIGVLGDTKDLTDLTTKPGPDYEMVSGNGRIKTYDARNLFSVPGIIGTDADDDWNDTSPASPGQSALVDAHFYANVTDNYYLSEHGFNWTTAYPQGIVSSAHVQRDYVNAYWNGSQMAYGDGNGTTFVELSGDLDVVGHELSHGVTEATSNLIYQNESGALNEAFSDIMGTAIEYYNGTGNWTIGEDINISGNGIRNMANPNEDGDPSHYAQRYTGTGDNGGVHINSGIANHWFYLLVNGGQNANATYASGTNVQSISLAAAENIAFLGFTSLSSSADFCAARAATMAVAGGSSANVTDAWDEVGVDDALCGGSGGGGSTTASCESATPLTSGDTVSVNDASAGDILCYSIDVPAAAIALDIATQAKGGRRAGDADLYGKFGSAPSNNPTDSGNDCTSASSNSNESCSISNPNDGTWYIVIDAYTAFTGLTLNATYTTQSVEPPTGGTDADGDGVTVEEGDCNDNDASVYPGANDTRGRKGRDGVDNNCDGVIDG
jgi:thermolysin